MKHRHVSVRQEHRTTHCAVRILPTSEELTGNGLQMGIPQRRMGLERRKPFNDVI